MQTEAKKKQVSSVTPKALARLYKGGHSLTQIAAMKGLAVSTVRDRILAGGGEMRERGPGRIAANRHRKTGGGR